MSIFRKILDWLKGNQPAASESKTDDKPIVSNNVAVAGAPVADVAPKKERKKRQPKKESTGQPVEKKTRKSKKAAALAVDAADTAQ